MKQLAETSLHDFQIVFVLVAHLLGQHSLFNVPVRPRQHKCGFAGARCDLGRDVNNIRLNLLQAQKDLVLFFQLEHAGLKDLNLAVLTFALVAQLFQFDIN